MRIQILNLPGPADEYPFALIADRVEPNVRCDDDGRIKGLEEFAREVGAASVLSFNGEIELD